MLKMAQENEKKQQQFRQMMSENPDKFVFNQVDKTDQIINRNMMLENTKIRKQALETDKYKNDYFCMHRKEIL